MISLGDIIQLLDRWDLWKKVRETPDRVDALERRVAALEAEIRARPKREACALCGGEMKVTQEYPHPVFGEFGHVERVLTCTAEGCGHTTKRKVDPAKG